MRAFVALVLLGTVCLDFAYTATVSDKEILRELHNIEDELMENVLGEDRQVRRLRLGNNGDSVRVHSAEAQDDVVIEGMKNGLKGRQGMFKMKLEEIIELIDDENFRDAEVLIHELLSEVEAAKELATNALKALGEIDNDLNDVLEKLDHAMEQTQQEATDDLENIMTGPLSNIVGGDNGDDDTPPGDNESPPDDSNLLGANGAGLPPQLTPLDNNEPEPTTHEQEEATTPSLVGTPTPESGEVTPDGTPPPESGEVTPDGTPTQESGELTPDGTPPPESGEVTPDGTPTQESGEVTPTAASMPEKRKRIEEAKQELRLLELLRRLEKIDKA